MYKYLIIVLCFFSCASMNDISVYNKELISDEGIDGFTSIEIFSTGGTDEVWGNSDKNCNPFSFSSYDASIDYTFTNASYDKINDTIKVRNRVFISILKFKG